MSENKNLNAALLYATKYGWAVFPVKAESKRPLTPHGCKDAKKDPGAIRSWWRKWPDASVGVATGSISNLIVIDEDVDDDKGIDGIMSMSAWETENGCVLPESARAITGRGGAHIYYHYDGKDIQNRAGIIEGVDVRGECGYVVAPPSIHPNGVSYAWEDDPSETPIANVDEVVRKFLSVGSGAHDTSERFQLPQVIESGKRNKTMHSFACSLQSQGLSDAAIRAAVKEENALRCVPPLDDAEIDVIIGSALKYAKGESKILAEVGEEWRAPKITMMVNKDGELTDKPAQTVANAVEAIKYDKDLFGRIRYNEIAYAPSVYGNLPWRKHKGWRDWDSNDDNNLWGYIEDKYGLKDANKIMAALSNVANAHPVNPIKQMLEEAHDRWDGNSHVADLLPLITGAEKTEYNTAALRLFMMGAVARIYHPGCKFDYMLVLVGEQGKYKSSFFRFLAINDTWLSDNFNSLDGDRAFEKLRGMWIVELAELQATKRAKDVETIKSFITSRDDIYRSPYSRRTEHHPRMCVLAGTSNPVDFLTDRTGNRRFLPVTTNVQDVVNPWLDEIGTKAIVLQAWGEIMDEFMRCGGKPRLVLPPALEKQALEAQIAYLEEDPDIGIIQEWLDKSDHDRVCAIQLWKEALGHVFDKYERKNINAIHEIMKNSIEGWHYIGRQRCGEYGLQRAYERDVVETPFGRAVCCRHEHDGNMDGNI